MPLSTGRTYHDPLHGAIALNWRDPIEVLLIRLIDTPAFQRLRRIRQLGPASLTFHGAESSRFTHSIGVMAVARRAFDQIADRYPELWTHRATVLCAALLHDIGHGAFSHTCEEVFGSHHEHWTRRILRESPPIRSLLDGFDRSLLEQIERVYEKRHPLPLVWQLVTSQLDCDRLDYLMRDSYMTGASYGKLDLDRILGAMDYDPATQQLVVSHKSMTAVEHYLTVRFFMYAQVYNHPKNIAATWVLEQAFRRAKLLLQQGRLSADETVTAWLQQDCDRLPLDIYLSADDGVFVYHLQRWQQHPDATLADLCRRFIDRDLLKAIDITDYSAEQQQAIEAKLQSQLGQMGKPIDASPDCPDYLGCPDYYVGRRTVFAHGYTLYQRGIKLQTATGLRELSELSPLVKTLAEPQQRSWLIYPRELEKLLETE